MAGATRLELATFGVTGESGFSDFNSLAHLAYQDVSKCGKSWGESAPQVHPVLMRSFLDRITPIIGQRTEDWDVRALTMPPASKGPVSDSSHTVDVVIFHAHLNSSLTPGWCTITASGGGRDRFQMGPFHG